MDAVMRRKFPRRRLGADLGRAEQVLFEEMEHAAELLVGRGLRPLRRPPRDSCLLFIFARPRSFRPGSKASPGSYLGF